MKRATITACPLTLPALTTPASVTRAISLSFETKSASAVTSRAGPSE
jgi:hypothetical protein